MNEFSTDRSFGYRFAMLHRLQMNRCRQEILGTGLQPSHLPFVICLVKAPEPVTQEHLSCCLAIDKGTTARALGRLEKNGFVSRRTNPGNRRQNLVTATPKARKAADHLLPVLIRASDEFVRGFSEEEKEQVLALMDRMLTNAREPDCSE